MTKNARRSAGPAMSVACGTIRGKSGSQRHSGKWGCLMPDAAFDITKPPFFSVVIPTYNRAEKLRRALESLLHQSYGDFEVLVCDDGSTDGTREVVSAYAGELQISYLWEENWGGPARPRNRGIAAAQGKWVCFLDADDWWHPDKLAKVHGLAES